MTAGDFRSPIIPSSACTIHAAFGRRINLEPTFRNADVTVDAATVATLIEALERRREPPPLLLPTACNGAGHGLALQRIHARQATDAALIERHGRIRSRSVDAIEFRQVLEKAGANARDVQIRH